MLKQHVTKQCTRNTQTVNEKSIFFTMFFLFIMMVFFTSYPLNHLNLERALITESYRLEKTLKIIESNRKPNTTKTTTIPCP
ncbi:hypothetical protein QYF61_010208 [Mycteria americana]|uniref:Uncharacterized protein n=1 Tax=Mycteria americana TaxID=33587 RepID=A0AAN7NF30_MYCAM|nr:hypothetical protein QYF61_010208 [Mycteria americana]